jgi:hypothetical protein
VVEAVKKTITATFQHNGFQLSRRSSHAALKFAWLVYDKASGVIIAAGFITRPRLPLDAVRHVGAGPALGQDRLFEIVGVVYSESKPRGRPRLPPYRIQIQNNMYMRHAGGKIARFKTEEEAKKFSDNYPMQFGEERKIVKDD